MEYRDRLLITSLFGTVVSILGMIYGAVSSGYNTVLGGLLPWGFVFAGLLAVSAFCSLYLVLDTSKDRDGKE